MGSKPIANKYHEGKMKRTLKRELKVPEIAEREANGTSFVSAIGACLVDSCFTVTQVLWDSLIRGCVLFLTRFVIVGSSSGRTLVTWILDSGE